MKAVFLDVHWCASSSFELYTLCTFYNFLFLKVCCTFAAVIKSIKVYEKSIIFIHACIIGIANECAGGKGEGKF